MLRRVSLLCVVCLLLSPGSSGTARAELVVVAHKDSPVTTLAPEQVKALFNGHVRAFPATSTMVTLIDHPADSVRYREFYEQVFNTSPDRVQRRRAAYLFSGKGVLPDTAKDDTAVIQRILETPSAIGYVDATLADERVKVVCRIPP
jgi:ABC-type phosphate transport system substrate-binding protein